jgi:hypothetical protein
MRNPRAPVHPNTDVLMDAADAQWPYNAPVITGPGLIMHQDCKACCSCDDYVNAYRAMLEWWERAQVVSLRIQQLQTTYNELCTLVKDGLGKIPIGVNVNLFMLARPDFNLALSFLMYNNSDAAIGTTQMVLEVSQPMANIEYIRQSGYLDFGGSNNFQIDPSVSSGGLGTKFTAVVAGLNQGAFVRYTLNLRFNDLLADRASTIITAKATGTWSGGSMQDLQRIQLVPPTQKD